MAVVLFRLTQSKNFPLKKFSFPRFFCGQPEHDAAVRAYDFFGIFVTAADVFQISAASDCFHYGKQNHHYFGADSLSVCVYGAAVGTGIGVSNFLTVSAVAFGVIAAEKSGYFDCKFIFFVIPFFSWGFTRVSVCFCLVLYAYALSGNEDVVLFFLLPVVGVCPRRGGHGPAVRVTVMFRNTGATPYKPNYFNV